MPLREKAEAYLYEVCGGEWETDDVVDFATEQVKAEREAVCEYLEAWAEGVDEGMTDDMPNSPADAVAADCRSIVAFIRQGDHRARNEKETT